jgi:hypothetical protein
MARKKVKSAPEKSPVENLENNNPAPDEITQHAESSAEIPEIDLEEIEKSAEAVVNSQQESAPVIEPEPSPEISLEPSPEPSPETAGAQGEGQPKRGRGRPKGSKTKTSGVREEPSGPSGHPPVNNPDVFSEVFNTTIAPGLSLALGFDTKKIEFNAQQKDVLKQLQPPDSLLKPSWTAYFITAGLFAAGNILGEFVISKIYKSMKKSGDLKKENGEDMTFLEFRREMQKAAAGQ